MRDDEAESEFVCEIVAMMLFSHLNNAGFQFDADSMRGSPLNEINYYADLLSRNQAQF